MGSANSTKRMSPYTLASSRWVKLTAKAHIYSPMDHSIKDLSKITWLKGQWANTNQKTWDMKEISKITNSMGKAKRKESIIHTKASIIKEIKLMGF